MAHCEDLTGRGIAGIRSRIGDSEATGGDVRRWTMVSSSEDVVRVTFNHLVLSGVTDRITFTTKVHSDNSWEVSVTSPRKVPVIHRLSLLEITTNCLFVVSCLNCSLLLTDFQLQVDPW